MSSESKNVYQAIAAVAGRIAKIAIGKDRINAQQGFSFRGIDDIYNGLAKIMAEEQLVILPRCRSREATERLTRSGSALFYVTVDMEFDFVSASDSSRHTVRIFGEAMDSGDKATNKAISAAYKYAAIQAFCIPTKGDNDADAHTHQVQPHSVQPKDNRLNAKVSVEPVGKTPIALLGEEQIAVITSLAQEVGKPLAEITRAHGTASLNFIEARYYESIIRRLNEYTKGNAQ